MQCPSCYNDSLIPTEEGKLVCGECGEEFAGYREEEMDGFLAGTAVSNRESQSSHARGIREKIAVKSAASSFESTPVANTLLKDDTLLCEAAFILAKAIADRLIRMRYVHPRIKTPLFELLTHWAGRQHRGLAGIRFRYRVLFRPNHVLSLICLAALYIRSPMLPRDLCRLIATRQVPYVDAWKIFPENLQSCPRVREAFTPVVVPTVLQICEPANIFARDVYSWPPIREFFKSNVPRRVFFVRRNCLFTAFPVGHLHITLLRLSRLLGLPDDFGARVLRFRELRMIAVKMARTLNRQKGGPWDRSRVDESDVKHIPMHNNLKENFVSSASSAFDMYGFPTDESVQIDFINTMRICYGTRPQRKTSDLNRQQAERERKLEKEWNECLKAMDKWLKLGNSEDVDVVMWSSVPPNVIAAMKGRELASYCGLVDDILSGLGDEIPDLWGRFTRAFEEIAGDGFALEVAETKENADKHICQYDFARCGKDVLFKPLQGRREMMEDCGHTGHNPSGHLVHSRKTLRTAKGAKYRKSVRVTKSGRGTNRAGTKRRRPNNREITQDTDRTGKTQTPCTVMRAAKRQKLSSEAKRQTKHQKRKGARDSSDDDSVDDGDSEGSEDVIPWVQRAEELRAEGLQHAPFSRNEAADKNEVAGEASYPRVTSQESRESFEDDRPLYLTQPAERGAGSSEIEGAKSSIERRQKPHVPGQDSKSGAVRQERLQEGINSQSDEDDETGEASSKLPLTFLKEPVGIGLAWTIIRSFFAGSNLIISGLDQADTVQLARKRMVMQLNHAMRIVVLYILGLQSSAKVSKHTNAQRK